MWPAMRPGATDSRATGHCVEDPAHLHWTQTLGFPDPAPTISGQALRLDETFAGIG